MIDTALQRLVRERAKDRCEYCRFSEALAEAPFHLDHVVARQHGGPTSFENLALACCFCNRYKGTNLSGVDPASGRVVLLYHPRRYIWEEHFRWQGAMLLGLTENARATIEVLKLNRADAIAVRQMIMREGVYPAEA